MSQPVVAHSVNPFLFSTGSWVYGQLKSLSRYRAIVVCKRRENTETFPFDRVFAREELTQLDQFTQRVARRVNGGFYPFMRDAIRSHESRVLHSHFASQGWTDLPLARATRLPHVTSFYGADIWKNAEVPAWRRRYRDLFARGAMFLVEGGAMRTKVESLGCPGSKIVVQHLGIELGDIPMVERRLGGDGLVRVLMSGRAVEKKGFELGVRAFALAAREMPTLRLSLMVIAKSKDELERLAGLHALVASEGIAKSVDFPPPRSYAEYRRALLDYHVYLAPSLRAANGDAEGGAPVSVSEMSASGMPIVASRHCDIPEVAPHGVSGLLFNEGDVEGCADALLVIARNPERWQAFGRAGRAHIEREYDLAAQAQKLEALYDGVTGAS
jgi:colanic acid/amylovoran biosynthesis glycosyltransferase